MLVPNDVDLGIVGNRFEGDVRHSLVDEAVRDVVGERAAASRTPGDISLLAGTLSRIFEKVMRIACAHQARACKRESNAASVDGYPAAAPLLGDVGCCTGAASRVDDEVAGVGGHHEAALQNLRSSLNDVDFVIGERARPGVLPEIIDGRDRIVAEELLYSDRVFHLHDPLRLLQPSHT